MNPPAAPLPATPSAASAPAAPQPAGITPGLIGVFDSGVGGLSVLRALQAQLPQARMLYVADSGHAPYGERSDAFITERTERVADYLRAQGAGLLVLACNTATAVAARHLRARWPELPLVAVEPGIKPAVMQSPGASVGVLATPATLRSEKVRQLVDTHGATARIHLQPCPGLAGLIEQSDIGDPAVQAAIDGFCAPLREAGVDTVALGCTHYPFVAAQIQAALGPQVRLIDTSEAVARQAAKLWLERWGASAPMDKGPAAAIRLQTTGDVSRLQAVAGRWLGFETEVSAAPAL